MPPYHSRNARPARIILGAALLILLGACGDRKSAPGQDAARVDQPVLVTVATIATERLAQTVVRTGTLRARRIVRLHSQEEGRVETLAVYEGDRVKAGTLLLQLDDRLVRAELNKAEANRRQAEQDLTRLQRLAGRKLVSEDEQLRAETTLRIAEAEESLLKTRLGYTAIRAPFDGVITERMVEPGDAAPRFTHLLTLADPDSLVTEVPISELILPTLSVGDAVTVRIDALGAAIYAGRIDRIHPTVDANTRQGMVEIALDPVPPGAQAGQLCRVYLPGEVRPRRSVPLAALRQDTQGEYVYTIDAEGYARRTPVHSGMALGERIEIVDGLADGDRVITRGFINLAAGKPVKIVATADAPPTPRP